MLTFIGGEAELCLFYGRAQITATTDRMVEFFLLFSFLSKGVSFD